MSEAKKDESSFSALLCADPRVEFAKLMSHLGATEKMTAGERANYFAFFCHGYHARAGEAVFQNDSQLNEQQLEEALNHGLKMVCDRCDHIGSNEYGYPQWQLQEHGGVLCQSCAEDDT